MKQIDGKATRAARLLLGRLVDDKAQARSEGAVKRPRGMTFSPGEQIWIAVAFLFWCALLPLVLS